MNDHSALLKHTRLYINGEWVDAEGDEQFDVLNPADESVLATVSSASLADGARAVDAAAVAMKAWSRKTPRDRSAVLRRAYEIFMHRIEDFATIITLENGKAYGDAIGEANYSAEFFRWYAEEAVRANGYSGPAPSSGARTLVHQKPAGVALLITPWNYPAAMGARKIAPALAAGCSVVIKPASETPLTMLALMTVLEDAGVPPGVVNVLPSRNSGALANEILGDPRVRVVSFTGSTEVGRLLLKTAAEHVVKPAMELGGNAPFIVCKDADLEAAADGLMIAKMRNIGEACTAANRVYVHHEIKDRFVSLYTKKMAALTVGNGIDRQVDVGPLVNAETRDKVAGFVDDAIAKGAELVLGGTRPEGAGFYYPPTVLTDVPDTADCLHDEIFGPVAMIQTFKCEDDVIERANSTIYGLVAYIYTEDLRRGLAMSEQLEFGMIGLNRGLVSDPAAPFGGVKQSGIGREGGKEGMLEFQETQYISTLW